MRYAQFWLAFLMAVAMVLPASFVVSVPALAQETAVQVANDEGVPVGSVAITEVMDPFTGFNPDYPAEPGTRYVVAQVVFDADAGQRFDIVPYAIVLQDDAGFLWDPTSMILPDDALIPELSSQTLAPGSRITGLVGFALPEGALPARIYYQTESSRIVPLVTLIETTPPGIGEPISVADSEGNSGQVTVVDGIDPFLDLAPGAVIPDGQRLVLVTLAYENPGDGRFFSEPYGLLLQDANGDLWSAIYVDRLDETEIVPDLNRLQLAPGDRITGAVVFGVPEEIALSGLYASPTSNQLIQLAALGASMEIGAILPVTAPDADGSSTGVTATGDPCIALADWSELTQERIDRARELSATDLATLDPEGLESLGLEYAELAESQVGEAAPPDAEAANKALVATLRAYASAIAGTTEASAADTEATLARAGERLDSIETELARLAADCG